MIAYEIHLANEEKKRLKRLRAEEASTKIASNTGTEGKPEEVKHVNATLENSIKF